MYPVVYDSVSSSIILHSLCTLSCIILYYSISSLYPILYNSTSSLYPNLYNSTSSQYSVPHHCTIYSTTTHALTCSISVPHTLSLIYLYLFYIILHALCTLSCILYPTHIPSMSFYCVLYYSTSTPYPSLYHLTSKSYPILFIIHTSDTPLCIILYPYPPHTPPSFLQPPHVVFHIHTI